MHAGLQNDSSLQRYAMKAADTALTALTQHTNSWEALSSHGVRQLHQSASDLPWCGPLHFVAAAIRSACQLRLHVSSVAKYIFLLLSKITNSA